MIKRSIHAILVTGILVTGIFVTGILVTGCSNNTSRALYESIQNQNEVGKTPAETAISPAPSYKDYQSERESLKR